MALGDRIRRLQDRLAGKRSGEPSITRWRRTDRVFVAIVACVFLVDFGLARAITLRPATSTEEVVLEEIYRGRNPWFRPPPRKVELAQTKPTPVGPVQAPAARPAGGPGRRPGEMRQAVRNSGFIRVIEAAGDLGTLGDMPGATGVEKSDFQRAIDSANKNAKSALDSPADRRGDDAGAQQHIGPMDTGGGAGRKGSLSGGPRSGPPPHCGYDPEPEPSPVPGCDANKIAAVVKRSLSAIQNCYEVESKRIPTLQGKLVARVTIAPDGSVADFEVEEDTVHSAQMALCIERRFRAWHFPSSGQECVVAHPFVFTPAAN